MREPLMMTAAMERVIRERVGSSDSGYVALLTEIDALRAALDVAERVRLPVIATCGDCMHSVIAEDDEEWLCVKRDQSGESLGLHSDEPCPVRAAPPAWCPWRTK